MLICQQEMTDKRRVRQGFCIELTLYPFIPVGEVQEAERELEELDAAGSSPASDAGPV